MSICIGYNDPDPWSSQHTPDTLLIRNIKLTEHQIKLIKASWEIVNEDFMTNSKDVVFRLMKEAPGTIDLFTFAKGTGMYNPHYEMDIKRHSLKVLNAFWWAISKCDQFEEIKPELAKLGERHRNYGMKLCFIRPMESVMMDLLRRFLGHLFTEELQQTWSIFLKLTLYSIFHPLLRHQCKDRERVYVRDWSGHVVAASDKKTVVFWAVALTVFVGWLGFTFVVVFERYKRLR